MKFRRIHWARIMRQALGQRLRSSHPLGDAAARRIVSPACRAGLSP
jgi:hypothetical protein